MNSPQETLVVPLAHLGAVRVAGADADAFLQGQFSNDLRQLTPQRAQISSWNSAKGRMLALLHLLRRDEGIWLELEREILDATLKRLRMYVLRSKVTLENVSGECASLGVAGPDAATLLAALDLPAPQGVLEAATDAASGIAVLRRHGEIARYSLHGSASAVAGITTQLSSQAAGGSEADWRRFDILAGVPAVREATRDHFVPQMVNLDLLSGIAFDKGCYTGQEIVARLHYLGQLKRRMVVCRSAARGVAPGTPVHDGDEAQAVGEVVQSAPDDGGSVLSVVLQLSHAGSQRLRLVDGSALGKPEQVPPA